MNFNIEQDFISDLEYIVRNNHIDQMEVQKSILRLLFLMNQQMLKTRELYQDLKNEMEQRSNKELQFIHDEIKKLTEKHEKSHLQFTHYETLVNIPPVQEKQQENKMTKEEKQNIEIKQDHIQEKESKTSIGEQEKQKQTKTTPQQSQKQDSSSESNNNDLEKPKQNINPKQKINKPKTDFNEQEIQQEYNNVMKTFDAMGSLIQKLLDEPKQNGTQQNNEQGKQKQIKNAIHQNPESEVITTNAKIENTNKTEVNQQKQDKKPVTSTNKTEVNKQKQNITQQNQKPAANTKFRAYRDGIIKNLNEQFQSNQNTEVNMVSRKKPEKPKDFEPNIFEACKEGKLESVKWLIEEENVSVNSKDGMKLKTLLHYACECGHLSIVEYLISKGATMSPDEKQNYPIHYACKNGHLHVVQYLIEKENIDMNIKGWQGKTPLDFASENFKLSIVKYLKSIKYKNRQNKNPSTI